MSPVGARHWVCLEGMERRVDPAWRGVGPWEELRAQREDETSVCWCCCGAVGVVAVETLGSGFCLPPPTSHNKQRVCVLGGPWETTDGDGFFMLGRWEYVFRVGVKSSKFKRISISSLRNRKTQSAVDSRRRRRVSQLQALLLGGHFWATPALRLLVWGGPWPVRVPWEPGWDVRGEW